MTWNWCGNTPTINLAVLTANALPWPWRRLAAFLACLCQIQNAERNGVQQKQAGESHLLTRREVEWSRSEPDRVRQFPATAVCDFQQRTAAEETLQSGDAFS